jgi:hypothetical protein
MPTRVVRGARCSLDEVRAHVRYLQTTPVAWIADEVLRGRWLLSHATIGSVSDLGATETIFRDLGGVTAGGRCFLVREGFAALHDPRCFDSTSRKLVDGYLGMLRRGEDLELRVTLRLDDDGAERIYDGNKRCIALHQHAIETNRSNIVVPVLMVHPPA